MMRIIMMRTIMMKILMMKILMMKILMMRIMMKMYQELMNHLKIILKDFPEEEEEEDQIFQEIWRDKDNELHVLDLVQWQGMLALNLEEDLEDHNYLVEEE